MHVRNFGWLLLLGGLAAFTGCGSSEGTKSRPKIVPVSGSIKYKGAPVEGATVSFMTDGAPRTSMGKTDASGAFKLTTYDTDDGAPLGKHKVTIVKQIQTADASAPPPTAENYAKMMASGKGMPKVEVENQIPEKYSRPESSGLVREVIDGDQNEFNIDLID